MWFRSIFLKTLRDCRVPILGWGLGIGVLTPLMLVAIPTLLADAEARAGVLALARTPAVRLFAEPVDVLSPGGYVTWRLSLVFPLVSIWALLTVSRTLRGEEEVGALDVLLSAPRSRLRVVIEKLTAIATALLLIGGLIALMAFGGASIANVDLGLDAALLAGLNVVLLASVFGALAVLISQFTRAHRTASGITGALLGLSVVLTSAGRTVPNGQWIGRVSPLYYFELSKPLIPSYGANPRAMFVLAALSVSLSAIGVALSTHRDVGAPVVLPVGRRRPARQAPSAPLPLSAWSLRSVFARSLSSLSAATLWWSLAIAVAAALFTAILRQAEQSLLELFEALAKRGPMYAEYISKLTGGDVTTNASFLSVIFTLLVGIVATFAVTLANRWAADEEEGRLELLLGTPQPRRRVILAQFATVAVALLAVAGLTFGSVALTGAVVGLMLDRTRVAQAAFGMVPVGLVVAALGYLLSGWLRTAAVTGSLIVLLLASFLVTLLGPLFKWPDMLLQLSIFEQYGAPLAEGLRMPNTLGLLAVTAVALAIATVRFARKDLAR